MSALDLILATESDREMGKLARAEATQLRADLQAAQERIAEQARQLDAARVFAEYVSRRALWTESTLSHSAAIWLATNPAPEAEPQP